jgi:hypothetical protein
MYMRLMSSVVFLKKLYYFVTSNIYFNFIVYNRVI